MPVAAATAALDSATAAVLFAAGLIFLFALILGIWKYLQMTTSENHLAHPYVDVAHRAALLYSFATAMIAAFVHYSDFSDTVNLIAAFVMIFYFVAAIVSYTIHGALRDTDNQLRDAVHGTHFFFWTLVIGEVGGFVVLLAGFAQAQIL